MGFDLRNLRALDNHFGADGADLQRDVYPRLFCDDQHDALGFIPLEAFGLDRQVVRTDRQRGEEKIAAAVAGAGAIDAVFRVRNRDLSVGNRRAAGIGDGPGDGGGILRPARRA